MSIEFENMAAETISEQLLDYAKGRLSAEARAEIDAAAARSPDILSELEYYKGLARAAELESNSSTIPNELGWARLSREMDHMELENAAPVAANDNSRAWRYAAMALGIIAMGQFALQFMPTSTPDADARYVPVAPTLTAASGQITFAADASEGDIRELLLKSRANIIAGPSALGVYQISFADEQARKSGLEILGGATDIVESVADQ